MDAFVDTISQLVETFLDPFLRKGLLVICNFYDSREYLPQKAMDSRNRSLCSQHGINC